jgi:membrane protease YdiL (CAAX protease family)
MKKYSGLKMKNFILAFFIISIIFAIYLLVYASPAYIMFFHFSLLFISLYFLFKKDWKTTLKYIGVPGNFRNNFAWSIFGFFAIVIITMLMNFIMVYVFNIQDIEKITDKVSTLPEYLLFFAFLAAPFTEELFFRALISPRFGMFASSALFGLSHYAYGSVIEIAGTFIIGMMLCLIYKYSKSIVPCIVIHLLYNFVSLLAMGTIFK